MFLKTFLLLACVRLALLAVPEIYDKVNLTYAYEARCPFCLEFLDQHLYKGYKKLSKYINIELIPVVRSIGERGKIMCSHGENECYITQAQACVFERPGVTDAIKVEFLHCSEAKAIQGYTVTTNNIKACVDSVLKDIVSYDIIETCINSIEYASVLQLYGDKANGLGVEFVPWLATFGQYVELDYRNLRSNFVRTICLKLRNPPAACSASSSIHN